MMLDPARQPRSGEILLPERYAPSDQQLVRARSVQGLLRYARVLRGSAYVDTVVQELGVTNAYFACSERFVHPLFGDDVLTRFVQDGFTDLQIRQMGAMTLITNRHTEIGRLLSTMGSPQQLYGEIHERYTHLFDRMWVYRLLKLTPKGCTIEIRQREEIQDLFHVNSLGSRRMCLFRQGVYAAFLGNIQRRLARVTESECMYAGDSRCVQHLHWD